MKKILLVIGTRPETIKMAPVYHALRREPALEPLVCNTGQHKEIVEQMLQFFELPCQESLNVMTHAQDLFDVTGRVLVGMREVIERLRPDLLLVQGDTTTVMAATLAAFYLDVPVGHVEAGLRTGNMRNPFPEELNRCITDLASAYHFAPTKRAREALIKSGIAPNSIHVTGNTVTDALLFTLERLKGEPFQALDLAPMKTKILLTTHRRESFGEPIRNTFRAVREIVAQYNGLHVIFPAHPNPQVQSAVRDALGETPRVHVISPQPYPEFVKLLRDCDLVLTDSGGVQEEAPTLGKPVLVLRETTERPEGIEAGTARLIGTETARIHHEVARLLDDSDAYNAMATTHNPYGDGHASERIAEVLAQRPSSSS